MVMQIELKISWKVHLESNFPKTLSLSHLKHGRGHGGFFCGGRFATASFGELQFWRVIMGE